MIGEITAKCEGDKLTQEQLDRLQPSVRRAYEHEQKLLAKISSLEAENKTITDDNKLLNLGNETLLNTITKQAKVIEAVKRFAQSQNNISKKSLLSIINGGGE